MRRLLAGRRFAGIAGCVTIAIGASVSTSGAGETSVRAPLAPAAPLGLATRVAQFAAGAPGYIACKGFGRCATAPWPSRIVRS